MMKDKRFVFAGNRFFVLEEMLKAGLNVIHVFAVQGSYLEKELQKRGMACEIILDKASLISKLNELDFDIFLSNGLPHILPVIRLKEKASHRRFINIHPSYLPDLRGMDPVPGALLYGRDSGATCHEMNESIDGGDIISQVKIEYDPGLDAGLLYQLSFMAEQDVFRLALEKKFVSTGKQVLNNIHQYYTFKDTDLRFELTDNVHEIYRRIKAFNTRSKGAYFVYDGRRVKVMDAEVMAHPYLSQKYADAPNNSIVLWYEDKCIVKKDLEFLKLKALQKDA